MPTEHNTDDTRKFVDNWLNAWTSNGNDKQVHVLAAFYTDDCYYSDPGYRQGIWGKTELAAYFGKLLLRNPYWEWTCTELIPTAKGCVITWEAVIPAGEQVIRETGCDILELTNGLISRNEVFFDRQQWLMALR